MGDMVEVRRDHLNAGKLYVFGLDGRYVTTAWDSELDGIPAIDYHAARKDQLKEMHLRSKLLGEMANRTLPQEPIREYIEARKNERKVKGIPRTRPAELKSLENVQEAIEQDDTSQSVLHIDSNDKRFVVEPSEGESPQPSLEKRERGNVVPLFTTMTERYEYLCDLDRSFTEIEKEFLKEFYKEDAGKRMLKMDGNILDKKETEEMRSRQNLASLPLRKAN